MRYSNLHTHTVFSDGKHTMEENVAAAVENNMLLLGFSDHSLTPIDVCYCIQRHDYDTYLQTARELNEKSGIPVYAGLELDAYSKEDTSIFDYIIASVHYLYRDDQYYPLDHNPQLLDKCIREAFGGNALDMVRCYCDTLGEHVAKVGPTFVGHFDLIAKFSTMPETDERYQVIMADKLKEIISICPYIELNTGAISRGWRKLPYPADFLLDVVRDNGGRILLSSDCHDKGHLTYWFDEAVELLKEKKINSIWVFNGNGFDEQSI